MKKRIDTMLGISLLDVHDDYPCKIYNPNPYSKLTQKYLHDSFYIINKAILSAIEFCKVIYDCPVQIILKANYERELAELAKNGFYPKYHHEPDFIMFTYPYKNESGFLQINFCHISNLGKKFTLDVREKKQGHYTATELKNFFKLSLEEIKELPIHYYYTYEKFWQRKKIKGEERVPLYKYDFLQSTDFYGSEYLIMEDNLQRLIRSPETKDQKIARDFINGVRKRRKII